MATRTIFVSRGAHPKLHPSYEFDEPLPGLVPARNVLQAMGYLMAAQGDDKQLADKLLYAEPELIESILCQNLLCQNAPECLSRVDVLQDFVQDQMLRPGSPLRAALFELAEGVDVEISTKFVICDRAEFFWSAGLSREEAEPLREIEWPGLNLFGDRILIPALRSLSGSDAPPKVHYGIPRLTAHFAGIGFPVLFSRGDFRSNTVLAACDSYGGILQAIEAGDVLVKRGGRFTDMIQMVDGFPQDLRSFRGLVIHCGANVIQRPWLVRRGECDMFVEWILAIAEQLPELKILISLVVPHETYDSAEVSVEEFNLSMKNEFERFPNVTCITWQSNPFADETGQRNRDLFGRDDFHLSPRGFRVLWKSVVKGSVFEGVPITVKNEALFEIGRDPDASENVVIVEAHSSDERLVVAPRNRDEESCATADAADVAAAPNETARQAAPVEFEEYFGSDFEDVDIELIDPNM